MKIELPDSHQNLKNPYNLQNNSWVHDVQNTFRNVGRKIRGMYNETIEVHNHKYKQGLAISVRATFCNLGPIR
jgi:hypothetical protein